MIKLKRLWGFPAALVVVLSFLWGAICPARPAEAVRAANAAEAENAGDSAGDNAGDSAGDNAGDSAGEKLNRNITIVIDPGHGRENDGAKWNGWIEKNITMVTAKAMKEHLEKFEGVDVILTHENTEDTMEIEDRCKFAARVGADFMVCLHYNMSGRHTHYGAEIWIPRKGDNNRLGYQFGVIEMNNLKAIGLSDRGIKTRKNSKGEDYYGMLRYSQEQGVPCVLIEHAHLDHQRDSFFTDELTDFARFGRIDAESVAMFYGLKSEELGLDFSTEDYRVPVKSDKTYGIDSATLHGDYVIDSEISPVEDPAKLEGSSASGAAQEEAEQADAPSDEKVKAETTVDWGGLKDLRDGMSAYAAAGETGASGGTGQEVSGNLGDSGEAGDYDQDYEADEEIYRESGEDSEAEEVYRESGDRSAAELLFEGMTSRQRNELIAVLALIALGTGACLISTAKR